MNVSMWRASFAEMYASTLKPLTSPAMRQGKAEASKREIGTIPELPETMLLQASAIEFPTGEMIPRPVMTTRRRLMRWRALADGSLLVRADVVDRLLDGRDLLRLFVGD